MFTLAKRLGDDGASGARARNCALFATARAAATWVRGIGHRIQYR